MGPGRQRLVIGAIAAVTLASATPALAVEKTAACPAVIEVLERLVQVMPIIAGTDDNRSFMLMVATSSRDATGKAKAAGWSLNSLVGLGGLEAFARKVMSGDLAAGPDATNRARALSATLVVEAKATCIGTVIPDPAAAG